MTEQEWDTLAERIAMVRHRAWCIEDKYTGSLEYKCEGPKPGDLELGKAVATELWGARPEDDDESA